MMMIYHFGNDDDDSNRSLNIVTASIRFPNLSKNCAPNVS